MLNRFEETSKKTSKDLHKVAQGHASADEANLLEERLVEEAHLCHLMMRTAQFEFRQCSDMVRAQGPDTLIV